MLDGTYWVVHMPYIASKASGGLKALSWVLFQNSSFYDSLDIRLVQIITLIAFSIFCMGSISWIKPIEITCDISRIFDVCYVNSIYYLNDGSTCT